MPEIEEDRPSRVWRLSDAGRASCGWLGDWLAAEGVTHIVSSAEPKAAETAQLAAQRISLTAAVREDLHENDRTGLGYLGLSALHARMRAFFNEPGRAVIGAETANAAEARFSAAVRSAIAGARGESLAIVTHGTVMSLFVARHNAIDPFAFWESLTLPAIVVLEGETFALARTIRYPAA